MSDLDFADLNSYASGAVNLAFRPQKMDGTEATTDVDIDAATNPGFTPIGDSFFNSFTGTFEGNGFTISNLYVNINENATNDTYAGLFGSVNNGTVRNLGLLDAYIKGTNTNTNISIGRVYAGGLVGFSSSSTIQNCYVTGNVTGTGTSSPNVNAGGLVGFNSDGTVTNSYATGTVSGTGSGNVNTGGLVGSSAGTVTNSYATGTVTAEGTGSGDANAGGLVGFNRGGTVTNSYATGTVSGTVDTGTLSQGGLVGSSASNATTLNSFWDTETTMQSIGIGGADADQTGVTGKTTTEMQLLTADPTDATNGAGWSTNNWDFGNTSQYPTLRSYEGSTANQVQGFVICNQPTTTHIQCNTTAISLRGVPVNFGEITTTTTFQLIIAGRNLSGEVTLSALTAPFAYAGRAAGQTLTLAPTSNRSINASIPITLTPTADYQKLASNVTISGGGLTTDVEIALTGISIPALTEDANGLLEINYIEQLNVVRNNLDGDYKLIKNLDFANDSHYASGAVNLAYHPLNNANPTAPGATVQTDPAMGLNPGWTPIGESFSNSFTGTLEGNDFTISNLYINISSTHDLYTGLFGYVGNGTVQNLGLLNAYVQAEGTGNAQVNIGGLVGYNSGGTITNCYAIGTVSAEGAGDVSTGGLVGWNSSQGTIRNCSTTVDVTAEGTGSGDVFAGGLVGFSGNSIRNSYATGEVTGTNTGSGDVNTGGLVGRIENGTIENSYATGEVTGTAAEGKTQVGGLVGLNNQSTIRNSYATGTVTAEGTDSGDVKAGGLMGESNGAIRNCYATGTATGTATGSGNVNTGGLVGENSFGDIINSYATGEASGTANTGTLNEDGFVGENDNGTITNSFFEDDSYRRQHRRSYTKQLTSTLS